MANMFQKAGERLGAGLIGGALYGKPGRSGGPKRLKAPKSTYTKGSDKKGKAPKTSSRPKARPKRKQVGSGT